MPPQSRPPAESPADLLFSHADLFNPFTCTWEKTSFALKGGTVLALEEVPAHRSIDLRGAKVIPGLIDAHVHIESSLLVPSEYGRVVLGHGITTVIADPHEIANVLGVRGIRYLFARSRQTPLDVLFMLPSSVPATPQDRGGAHIGAEDLRRLKRAPGVLGLGEVMDVYGVIEGRTDLAEKIDLFDLVDGHAPLLTGPDLDRYIAAGIQSDHESTGPEEALEKIRKGMYLMIREGSTERNLSALVKAVSPCALSRWSFASDDRHADDLAEEGSIDACVRKALAEGMELEVALRLATLSPCDRFRLLDRGAVAPGRIADFCILEPDTEFRIRSTFKRGVEVTSLPYRRSRPIASPFPLGTPGPGELVLPQQGTARVIGLCPDQILTRDLRLEVDGPRLPDTSRDILKVAVFSRYREGRWAVGLVRGFGLSEGAIAGSVAHDAHNIVAVGSEDSALLRAAREVIRRKGGLVAVSGTRVTALALDCAGLMSTAPYPEVVARLRELDRVTEDQGAIEHPFMYLSFLTLTVIPALRITEQGVWDTARRTTVPLFASGPSSPGRLSA